MMATCPKGIGIFALLAP
jgi:hypothetical protein